MKTVKYLLITLFFTLCASLFGENDYFILRSHSFDIAKAKTEISAICKDGYIPVGLDVQEGNAIFITYIKDTKISFSNWSLIQISEMDKVNAQLEELLSRGWLPTGFSKSKSSLYILFLKTEYPIKGIRIANTDLDLKKVNNTLTDFMNQGYVPFDISYSENKIWYILLNVPSLKTLGIYLDLYDNLETMAEGVKKETERGRHPWGMMTGPEKMYILYRK